MSSPGTAADTRCRPPIAWVTPPDFEARRERASLASAGDAFDTTYELRRRVALPRKGRRGKGYRVRGTAPFKSILVKPGKMMKVVAKGTTLEHSLARQPEAVAAELRLGARRYCLEFGGSVAFTPGRKLLAKDAPQPAGCPG